jgi:hypothetical protein
MTAIEYIGNDRKARMGREARKVLALCINAAPGGQRAMATPDALAFFGLAFAIDAINRSYDALSPLGQRNAGLALAVLENREYVPCPQHAHQRAGYCIDCDSLEAIASREGN